MVHKIDKNTDLGKILAPLLGFNRNTSVQGVVNTGDIKHIAKRELFSVQYNVSYN